MVVLRIQLQISKIYVYDRLESTLCIMHSLQIHQLCNMKVTET